MKAATGAVVWTQRVGAPCIHEIAVCRGAFVVVTSKGTSWLDPKQGTTFAQYPFPRRRWVRAFTAKGRRLVVALSNGKGACEVLGFRDSRLMFKIQHDFLANLQWLPSGLLVETRFDGIGVLDPRSGERWHDVGFREECEAAHLAEFDGRLYVLTMYGTVYALRWPPRAKDHAT